jgi:hypothetical protein
LNIHGFIRADLIVANKDQWDPIARLGIVGQYYGIESMNKKSGASIGKGMDPKKLMPGLLEVKDWFNQHCDYYRGNISLICGLPHETKDTWNSGIQWVIDNWQGESSNLFPLDIPTDSRDAKLSFISQNYKTLGYRETSKERRPGVARNGFGYGRSLLDWENDNMTLEEAEDLVDDANDRLRNIVGVNPWQFGDYALLGMSLKEIAGLNKYYKSNPNNEYETFVSLYIEKKLK